MAIDKWEYRMFAFNETYKENMYHWGNGSRVARKLCISKQRMAEIFRVLTKRGWVRKYRHGHYVPTMLGLEVVKKAQQAIDNQEKPA